MTVHSNDQGQTQTQQPVQPQVAATQQPQAATYVDPSLQQQTQTQQTQQTSGSHNMTTPTSLDAFFRKVPKNANSGSLAALRNSVDAILAEVPEVKDKFKIIVADRDEKAVPYSTLIVTLPTPIQGGQTLVPYYVVLLSKSRDENLEPYTVQSMTAPISVPRVPSDALGNETVRNNIQSIVRAESGIANATLVEAGLVVVGGNLDLTNVDAVRPLFSDAVTALSNVVTRRNPNAVPFSVAALAGKRVHTRASFNQPAVVDSAGNPVRTDIVLSVTVAGQSGQNDPFADSPRELVNVGGYIDLMLVENRNLQPVYGQAPQTQRYVPRFIVTNISTNFDMSADQMVLLGINAVGALAARKNWVKALLATDGPSLHDFGAIGLEVPMFTGTDKGAKINVKNLSVQSQVELITDAVFDNLIIQVDIPESGDTGRLLNVINGLVSTDQEIVKKATARVFKAANDLTLNNFSNVWNTSQLPVKSLVAPGLTKQFLGFYKDRDRNGQLADIRNIDHLAVLNVQGPQSFNYDQTFISPEDPIVQASRRLQIAESVLGGQGMVEVIDVATRVTIAPAFIIILDQAIRTAGLNIDIAQSGYLPQGNEYASYEQFASAGIASSQFTQQYTTAMNPSNGATYSGGRYRG